MLYLRHCRRRTYAAFAVLLVATAAVAQNPAPQTLPPTQPTTLTPAVPAAAVPAPNPPQFARVILVSDQIEVHANNSSLNQILRAICRLTNLKVTGGVADERVFGDYGPAPTATILATLLDGTGTNILLLEGSATSPPRLILSPRGGGAMPPSPDSPVYATYDNPQPPTTAGPTQALQSTPSAQPQSSATPNALTPAASNQPAKAASTAPPEPSKLTPEMVAQKILEMQHQAAQPLSTPTPPH